MRPTRRTLLGGAAALALSPRAQAAPAPGTIAVRVDRDFEVLDPAFRTGLQDGNIVRAITQRLIIWIETHTSFFVQDLFVKKLFFLWSED